MAAEASNMDKIIEGVVIGVVAGVVVALFLGAYDQIQRLYHRQEQIRHIRAVIEKTEDRIQKAEDKVQEIRPLVDEGERERLSAGSLSLKYYQSMIRELTMILEDRSGALSYEERYELRESLGTQEEYIGPALLAKKIPPIWFYEQHVFNKLYSLGWIGSKRQPAQP